METRGRGGGGGEDRKQFGGKAGTEQETIPARWNRFQTEGRCNNKPRGRGWERVKRGKSAERAAASQSSRHADLFIPHRSPARIYSRQQRRRNRFTSPALEKKKKKKWLQPFAEAVKFCSVFFFLMWLKRCDSVQHKANSNIMIVFSSEWKKTACFVLIFFPNLTSYYFLPIGLIKKNKKTCNLEI